MSDLSLTNASAFWTLGVLVGLTALINQLMPPVYRLGLGRGDWLALAIAGFFLAALVSQNLDQNPAFHHYANSPLRNLVFPPGTP